MRNYLIKSFALLTMVAIFASSCSSTKTAKAPNYIGTWTYSIDTPQGTTDGYLAISQEEKDVIGMIGSDMGESALSNFEVSEEKVFGTFAAWL